MNVWKPIALCSIAGLVISVGVQTASAQDDSCHNQGNMAAALHALRGARASLDHAEHNKGGWRDRAITATDAALKETVNGCNYANNH